GLTNVATFRRRPVAGSIRHRVFVVNSTTSNEPSGCTSMPVGKPRPSGAREGAEAPGPATAKVRSRHAATRRSLIAQLRRPAGTALPPTGSREPPPQPPPRRTPNGDSRRPAAPLASRRALSRRRTDLRGVAVLARAVAAVAGA